MSVFKLSCLSYTQELELFDVVYLRELIKTVKSSPRSSNQQLYTEVAFGTHV